MDENITIALVVCHAPFGKIEKNISAMARWVEKAVNGGAGIICFPELNVTGYGNKNDVLALAQPVPGPASTAISKMAGGAGLTILAGLVEKASGGRVYASHLVAEPNGVVSVYRKLYLAPPERIAFSPGNRIPVFTACGLRFGIQLCYDAHFPELSTHMTAKGVEAIFIPHASPRGDAQTKHTSWMRHLPARAYDNSVFIAACNQIGQNGNGLAFPGNAVVLSPSGDIIGSHLTDREGILFADLKVEKLKRVREHEMRHFFPNRRPELY